MGYFMVMRTVLSACQGVRVNIAGARCIRVSIMTHQTLYTHMGVSCSERAEEWSIQFHTLTLRRCDAATLEAEGRGSIPARSLQLEPSRGPKCHAEAPFGDRQGPTVPHLASLHHLVVSSDGGGGGGAGAMVVAASVVVSSSQQ